MFHKIIIQTTGIRARGEGSKGGLKLKDFPIIN